MAENRFSEILILCKNHKYEKCTELNSEHKNNCKKKIRSIFTRQEIKVFFGKCPDFAENETFPKH